MGGGGKTRLALRVVEEIESESADEAWWIELAPLDDDRLIASTICSTLNVTLTAGVEPMEALAKWLGSSSGTVLALDNCEHLVDACAEVVTALLDRCPDLRVLATSREPLGIPGEVTWPVLSLSVPDQDAGPEALIESAAEASAVQLFVDRARAVRPDFGLTRANAASVARLCRQLDGIPLAVELAAARAGVLSVEQIVERLEEGQGLLRRTGRQVTPRHHTMRAALDWSHDLLPEIERVLFRRLGVFGGHASLEACEGVCAGGPLEGSRVLDALGNLVDKSMVVVDSQGRSATYRLLEPVRSFALARLRESGELEAIAGQHARHYLALARTLAPDLKGAGRAAALEKLRSEHDNLRRAWDYALESGDGATVSSLARALFWFWNFGGHFDEGRTRSEEALDRLGADTDGGADLLYGAGTLAWMQGDHEVALARLEACRTACDRAGNDHLRAVALRELAGVRVSLGELDTASRLYEESVAHLQDPEDAWDLALALAVLADAREGLGKPEEAREARDRARALFGRLEDPWGLSLTHFGLGVAAARNGDLEAGRIHAREALALQRAGGDDWNIGQILLLLGEVEQRAGRHERAAELFRESVTALNDVGDRPSLAFAITSLAEVEGRQGRTLRAVRLAAAGDAQSELSQGAYPFALATAEERAATIDAVRRAAGEEAFAEEWALGRSMTLDQAVAFALEAPAGHGSPRRVDHAATATLRVYALGPPEVYRHQRRLRPSDWTFALPKELLFYLLLHGPRTKEQIGLDFWPEASKDQLRGRFRTTLYHLRRAVGGTEWVVYRDGRYAFNRELDYWLDTEAFEAALDEANRLLEADAPEAGDRLEHAVALYRGELLEGEVSHRWVSAPRDRLRRRYLDALLTQGRLRTSSGAHRRAAEAYRQAVRCDELNEAAHRELALSLARAGDRPGALRHLDELDEILRRELDAEPSGETLEVRARLERGKEA